MIKKRTCENGFHNPSKYKNPIMRFFHFLFCKNRLYYREDDTALCAQCNGFVRTPLVYYQGVTKAAFVVIGMLAVALLVLLPKFGYADILVGYIIVCLIVIVLIRITDAFVFAFFPWRLFDETKDDSKAYCERAENERDHRYSMIRVGLIIGIHIGLLLYGIRGALGGA